jgi:hypothetical protein
MSFQLNLSSLALGAKNRLSRLEASSGALRSRLLSPLPGGSSADIAPGLSSVSFSLPPAEGSRPFETTSDVEVGAPGEFHVSGGGSPAASLCL